MRRARLSIAAGTTALLLVLAVLVTGLFVPGWLLNDGQRSIPLPAPGAAAALAPPPAAPVGTPLPLNRADRGTLNAFAQRYVAAFNTRNVPVIGELACRAPSEQQRLVLSRSLRLQRQQATLSGPPVGYRGQAVLPVTLRSTASGAPRTAASALTVRRDGRGWCVP